MNKEALIYGDYVTYTDENGKLKERENTPYIEKIMKSENEIEIIKNAIKDNKKEYKKTKLDKKDLLLYWLVLTFGVISIVALEMLLIVEPVSAFSNLLFRTSDIYFYLSFLGIELLGTSIILIKKSKYNKKLKKLNKLKDILNNKLSKKEKELEDLKAKLNTYKFEKNKEKRLIDFTKAKEDYQNRLDKELGIEAYINKDEIKPKVYGKHLISK